MAGVVVAQIALAGAPIGTGRRHEIETPFFTIKIIFFFFFSLTGPERVTVPLPIFFFFSLKILI